jgi:hypothetical protein
MDINFNKNEDFNKLSLSDFKQKLAKVKLGGGENASRNCTPKAR